MYIVITDPFEKIRKTVTVGNKEYLYYNLPEFGAEYGNVSFKNSNTFILLV